MNTFKKVVSIFCVLAVSLCVFCSCSQKNEVLIKLGDKEYSQFKTVLKLDDYEVSLGFYRYCYLMVKDNMKKNDPDIDFTKEETIKELNEETMWQVKNFYAVDSLAKKYGYTLSSDDLASIDDAMKSAFDSAGNAKDYKAMLEKSYLTHEVYENALKLSYLNSNMSATLFGTDAKTNKETFTLNEAITSYEKTHCRLMSIYYPVDYADEDGVYLNEEEYNKEKAAVKAKADATLKKIRDGASFEIVLKQEMGEDVYKNDLQNYYDFESFSVMLGYDLTTLEIGQTTEPIFTQDNYFLVHRLKNDNEYLKENPANVISAYSGVCFANALQDISDNFKVKETDLLSKITPDSLS
ncbi:MAG: hypothetical protein E7539_02425 [Ruminococcaceae bacterium]|nr:hypothetical protein [Oscillospiraceae bacterium]